VAVEAELGRVREAGAKIAEEEAKVPITEVEVIGIDQGVGIHFPRNPTFQVIDLK
jgi:hypothetical protein